MGQQQDRLAGSEETLPSQPVGQESQSAEVEKGERVGGGEAIGAGGALLRPLSLRARGSC